MKEIISSKIHGAVITKKELNYNGSIGIDKTLLKESGISPGEKVQVLNFNNGTRFETYAIEEKENSKAVALYGPAARCGEIGDKVVIIAYALVGMDEVKKVKLKTVFVNEKNEAVS